MREIQKDIFLNYISSIGGSVIYENNVHIFFTRYGKERDIDIVNDEVKNCDEERLCDSG